MAEPEKTALSELDKLFVTLIEGAKEKGPKVVDWLYAEVPEVVEQLLMWHFAESLFLFVVCFFFLFIFPYCLYILAKHIYVAVDVPNLKHKDGFYIPAVVISVVSLVASQITCWNNINLTWLKITVAPKVYLLEYVSHLVR